MTPFDDISTSIEARIATGFARICTVMRSQAWGKSMAEGITPTQADVISLLRSRQASLRLTVIAEQLVISPATASDAVSTLVSKGLVEKVRAPDDGRAIALSLTRKGIRLAASIEEMEGSLFQVLQTLSDGEKNSLLSLIVKIIRTMQDRGDIPVMRMCLTCKYYAPHRKKEKELIHYCNLVKAPFADHHLRLDCPEHEIKDEEV
jgi:DNA-binding MarR family transcriptional regulator